MYSPNKNCLTKTHSLAQRQSIKSAIEKHQVRGCEFLCAVRQKDDQKTIMTRHVFFAGFSLVLSAALTYYINSSFIESIAGKTRVGLIYAFGAIVAIIFILSVPWLGRRYGLLKPIRWFVLIFFGSTLILALNQTPIIKLSA